MTDEIPYIRDNESADQIYMGSPGAEIILLIGKTQNTKDLTQVYDFPNYQAAMKTVANGGIGPEDATNELLVAIGEIFAESQRRNSTDVYGANRVYAINVGMNPTTDDWTQAQALAETIDDVGVEVYVLNSSLSFMVSTKTALDNAASICKRRRAFFTVNDGESIVDAVKRTDPDQPTYINSSRIYIAWERELQSKYAAKMAYTPYYVDPAYGGFRSVTAADADTGLTDDDRDTLTSAGLLCSMKSLDKSGSVRMAEPVKFVSTAYRSVDGNVPADSMAHQRRIADHCFNKMDDIARAELKHLNMADGLPMLTELLNGFLENEKTKGYIKSYNVACQQSVDNPFGLDILRKLQPTNTVYEITENSVIMSP